jgi:molybdopterin converting factor small subunit
MVKVKLIGVLASAAGLRELELDTPEQANVSDLIAILLKKVDNRQFRDFLVDSGTGDPRPNVVILLNEQDCHVFSGLKTIVEKGTVVTIIPVAHGGLG